MFRMIWRFLLSCVSSGVKTAHIEPAAQHQDAAVDRAAPTQSADFYFKEAILDKLDSYFESIRRLRAADPDAYSLYAELGGHILPRKMLIGIDELEPWWKTNRPAFGAVSFAGDKDEGDTAIELSLLYFRKYDNSHLPADVQRSNWGDIYVVTAYWSKWGRTGVPAEFAVAVNAAGEVAVLKQNLATSETVRAKKGSSRGKTFQVPQRRWRLSPLFSELAREKKSAPEAFMAQLFMCAANAYADAGHGMLRVDITKGAAHAAFSVDIKRTPYFFKDRTPVLGDDGKAARIFHIVRPHSRQSKNGTEKFIRMHFRGLRAFRWNGYDVSISVPGKDHLNLTDFDLGMHDIDPSAPNQGMVGIKTVAKKLRRAISQ